MILVTALRRISSLIGREIQPEDLSWLIVADEGAGVEDIP